MLITISFKACNATPPFIRLVKKSFSSYQILLFSYTRRAAPAQSTKATFVGIFLLCCTQIEPGTQNKRTKKYIQSCRRFEPCSLIVMPNLARFMVYCTDTKAPHRSQPINIQTSERRLVLCPRSFVRCLLPLFVWFGGAQFRWIIFIFCGK